MCISICVRAYLCLRGCGESNKEEKMTDGGRQERRAALPFATHGAAAAARS